MWNFAKEQRPPRYFSISSLAVTFGAFLIVLLCSSLLTLFGGLLPLLGFLLPPLRLLLLIGLALPLSLLWVPP